MNGEQSRVDGAGCSGTVISDKELLLLLLDRLKNANVDMQLHLQTSRQASSPYRESRDPIQCEHELQYHLKSVMLVPAEQRPSAELQ